MKKFILILTILFVSILSYSQNVENPTKDTSLSFIGDSLSSVGKDIQQIGSYIKEDYQILGTVGFIRVYKYFIITGIIIIFLTILWFRNNNDKE